MTEPAIGALPRGEQRLRQRIRLLLGVVALAVLLFVLRAL
jgi:hypothetical protein